MTGQNERARSWDDVSSDLIRLLNAGYVPIPGYVTHAAQAGVFEPSVVLNAHDLIRDAAASCRPPVDVLANPYTGSVNYGWQGEEPNVTVEVSECQYELYLSYRGRLDIRHFDHTPGDPAPGELLKQLPRS